jgi:hypothetical protein
MRWTSKFSPTFVLVKHQLENVPFVSLGYHEGLPDNLNHPGIRGSN